MKNKIETLSNDILNQIKTQFGENHKKAIKIIEKEISENESLNSNRIINCVIYLSENSLEKLIENLNIAKIDWRDIIFYAEKKQNEK
jgi:hypothetical protein